MIAVWGANGFIGRHVVRHLQQVRSPITLFSRDFEGMPYSLQPNMACVAADFNVPEDYCEKLIGCNVLVLMVTSSNARTFINTPDMEIANNLAPYENFLSSLKKRRIFPDRIIYLSSGGAVYGNTPHAPILETTPPLPLTPYGITKLRIEKSVMDFCNEFGCDYTILRVANPIGVHSKRASLVPAILSCCHSGQVLDVQGRGGCVRDYFDVGELGEAIVKVMQADSTRNTILNVGSGRGYSINEMIDMVSIITKIRPDTQYIPEQEPVISYNVLDCNLINRLTGWQATRPLQETIKEMWYSK